jgi:TatD DNase family protein
MITDSHAHLEMPHFDPDREDVILRARDAGLALIVTIGTGNPAQSSVERTLELAERFDFLYAAIGVHPHDARLAEDAYWKKMDAWASHSKVVLWGEIGLDYYYDNSPRDIQRSVFDLQLQMARSHGLPVSIHCRDAWSDLGEILRRHELGTRPGILHSFTGDAVQAREWAGRGFLISFSGMITFRSADTIRAAAASLDERHILIETDCPYLAPVPHRGKRNEPAFVAEVARRLAEIKGIEFERVAEQTGKNLQELLRPHGNF